MKQQLDAILDIITVPGAIVICPVCRAENFGLEFETNEQMECIFCGFEGLKSEFQTC